MSRENGLRDLICPTGCGGTDIIRKGNFTYVAGSMWDMAVCRRCGYIFLYDTLFDSYNDQLRDRQRVNNVSNR